MFLLDAGVWVAAKDAGDRFFSASRPLVLDPDRPVAALDLTYYEIANVVGAKWGRGEEARELAQTLAARCGERVVAVGPELVAEALEAVAEHGLTAYDAAYVAAARRNGWTLVSTDVADLVSKGLAMTPDAADYP
jgi:predicted nucleic acid-binding protein